MGTLHFMAASKIGRVGQNIRNNLSVLRRRKLSLQLSTETPVRDSMLDPILAELQQVRVRLEFQIRKLASEAPLDESEDQALGAARAIMADAAEMANLLIWFGANLPDDEALTTNTQASA